MKKKPLVTVVIPTYNHAQFLKEALKSVCSQTFPDWEAVVINNFSDDDTITVVEDFNDSRIRLLNFRNKGIIAASRNLGISLARGEYLAFLDSDDIWFPEKLSVCLPLLENGSSLVCHGLHLFGDCRERDQFYGPVDRASFDNLLYKGNCIATSSTMVKKSIVESVGGFSEDTNIVTVEDYHLWLKLAKEGAKIDFLNLILGGYRFHNSNNGNVMIQAEAEKHVVESFFPEHNSRNIINQTRVRFRYGIIDYEIARSMQLNSHFSKASRYFLSSLTLHPFFIKTYLAIILNIFLKYTITIRKQFHT